VLLTCTQCLRSFPFTVDHEPTGEVLHTSCIYCPHEVNYIIDFSRSVNSPEKRAAWKAAFLKRQEKSVLADVGPDDGSTEIKRKSEQTEWV
jgi:hypothetical protein